jgi:hypothetical protein
MGSASLQRLLPEVRVQDFPIRQHKVELSIKRRRWEVQPSGEIVTRDWDLVMKGARLTKEFALFLANPGIHLMRAFLFDIFLAI